MHNVKENVVIEHKRNFFLQVLHNKKALRKRESFGKK